MEKQERLEKIDAMAVTICKLMQEESRNEFFEFQEGREQSGEGYKKKYSAGRTYYKGPRKGQERDVFEVDGEGFNELWKLLVPFAMKSVNNFYHSRRVFSGEEEDALFDIKYQTLYVLRFHGPCPSKVPFSQFFPLICKNILSTISRRMYGVKDKVFSKEEGDSLVQEGEIKNMSYNEEEECWVKKGASSDSTKINFKTVSLFNDVMLEEGEDGSWLVNYIESPDNEWQKIEFEACVPVDLKEIVNGIMEGRSFKEVAEAVGIEVKVLKTKLIDFAEDFRQERV